MIEVRGNKGFSLVELMIVVAIMAILAAIAIPSFMKFSMKAKTAEASQNLAAIRTAQEAYLAENGEYLACITYPPTVPTGDGTPWIASDAGEFATIGVEFDGKVRYQYAVAVTKSPDGSPSFTATAEGDLDGRRGNGRFEVGPKGPVENMAIGEH